MGLKSTETVTCCVKLSVTNAFLEKIKSAVKKANFGKIISDKTLRCAELVSENWADNGGFLGNLRNGINSSPAAVFFNFTGKRHPGHCSRPEFNHGKNFFYVETSGLAKDLSLGLIDVPKSIKFDVKAFKK